MTTNYNTCVTQISNLTAISSNTLVNGDANFGPIFPAAIDYAENRLYRELDMVQVRAADFTQVSSGARLLSMPANVGTFIAIDQLFVITPSGSSGATGTLNPLTPASVDYVLSVYPSLTTNTGTPQFFAPVSVAPSSNLSVNIGPATDALYYFLVVGPVRPASLSAANSSTILTQMLPDVFNAALMVFMSAQMRNFGAQSDNPQLAQSWETQYSKLFQSANTEEVRRKFQSQGWTSAQPSPLATPARV